MPLTADRASSSSDTATSVRHGAAMETIRRRLGGLRFPMLRDELLAAADDLEVETSGGVVVPLVDILRGSKVDEFTSAAHVAEVARLNWSLPSDMAPPEGSG